MLYKFSYPQDECRNRIIEEGIPAIVEKYGEKLPESIKPLVLDRNNWIIRSTGDKARDLLIQASRKKRYWYAGVFELEKFSAWYSFESELRLGLPYSEEQKRALLDTLYKDMAYSDLDYVCNEIFGANYFTVCYSQAVAKTVEEYKDNESDCSDNVIPIPYPLDVDYMVQKNPKLVKISPDTIQIGSIRLRFDLVNIPSLPTENWAVPPQEGWE